MAAADEMAEVCAGKLARWPFRAVSLPWKRRLRRWHRRLAIITAVQLLLWTLSGIYFAFIDIAVVRGEPHRLPLPSERVDLSTFAFPVTSTSQLIYD